MLHGWIKLHRRILDHWSASEPEMLSAWIRLLLEANHQDSKKVFNGSLVEVKRGQLIFGYNAFSSKSGISKKKLERYMKLFESEGMIGRQRGSKYSLITITCYDSYQDRGGEGEAEGKQKGSKGEHRKNVKNEEEYKEAGFSPFNDVEQEIIINCWNSLGCKQHRGITKAALKAIKKTYAEYKKQAKEPLSPTEWVCNYLESGFASWMTDHHRDMGDNNWSADLEFAVRFSTYDKVKNSL